MTTELLSDDAWPALKQAARTSKRPADVSVAYFGKGASSLLKLPKGSRLVVDASERAVSSGQTSPADLLKLLKAGVDVYSVPNLHAKVYVFGRKAFIGSANVSRNSSENLVEALLLTTDAEAVAQSKAFVRSLCLHPLTPELLKHLQTLYRPPKIPGGKSLGKAAANKAALPKLHLAQLERIEWSEAEEAAHEQGMAAAKKKRQHKRQWELDSFRWHGVLNMAPGEVVLQVTTEDDGRRLVNPPANVIFVQNLPKDLGGGAFIFVEQPAGLRRRSAESVGKRLGDGGDKLLKRSGVVRNRAQAETLLGLWKK